MQRFNEFNERIAVAFAKALSATICFYIFVALALFGFPWHDPLNPAVLVPWLSQTFIQLVALNLLAVNQRVADEKSHKRHSELVDHHRKVHEHLGIAAAKAGGAK